MPLDTSTYTLAALRLDGRRWNELRRIHGQISTQSASDGSSYFEMGNTKVLCTVIGPQEQRRAGGAGGGQQQKATIEATISIAGFSGVDRKRRGRNDKRVQEMNHMIESAFESTLQLQLYPHSTINVTLHVLSQDGSLLAACLNAATLALIDAGIPMTDYVAACTVGTTSSFMDDESEADPLMDLNGLEENEVPFLTLGTSGGEDKVNVLMMETRVQMARLEAMISVALDGCRQIRGILDGIVRAHGQSVLQAKLS